MTSIEWLQEQIWEHIEWKAPTEKRVIMKKIEQAKEMHKQEVINTVLNVGSFMSREEAEQYYQETFVSKGSIEVDFPKQNDINVGYGDRIYDNEPKPKLPQQEISDEEIEKAFTIETEVQTTKYVGEIAGAKWYREQLKQRQ